MEDLSKVKEKSNELTSQTGHVWQAVNGYHAVTQVTGDICNRNNIQFHPASGVILKVFIDTVTGEVKFFPATMFEVGR